MKSYPERLKNEARKLRMQGKTYSEINSIFKTNIPKSTFVTWFKDVPLPRDYPIRVKNILGEHLATIRKKAIETNKLKRQSFLTNIRETNLPISLQIKNKKTSKIALAMLCLGEASKYGTGSAFYLGSSNPKIITLFINLLNNCFDIDKSKFRCTVQCRSDQNILDLENYWQDITNIPKNQFYKTRIDTRSNGKPTIKSKYHGVLRVDYLDTKVQLELESLADLVYNIVADQG